VCAKRLFPYWAPQKPLHEAREELELVAWGAGGDCPCCGQFTKVYKRKFNAGMARGLIWLVLLDEPEWTDVPKLAPKWLIKIAGEFAKSAHWGLSEQKPTDDPNQKCSGLWRPTEKGANFVSDSLTIPTHVYLYDNAVIKFTQEETTIREALGKRFSYEELMEPALSA
jgi:hypothetical protein